MLVFAAIKAQIAHAVRKGVRVLHYSVQHDHLHFIIEASDRMKASRAMQYLFSRIAHRASRRR